LPIAQRAPLYRFTTPHLFCTRPVPAFDHQILIDGVRNDKLPDHLLEQGEASNPGKGDDWSSIGNDHTW